VSRICPPNPDPSSLADIQILAAGVHEVEFARREFPVQSLIALHRSGAICASLDHGNTM
jgi:hypothetical protein